MPPSTHRRPPLFIGVIFSLLFVFNIASGLLTDRLLAALGAAEGWRVAGGLFFTIQAAGLALFLHSVFSRRPGPGLGRYFLSLIFIWNLLLSPVLAVFLVLQSALGWLTGAKAVLWAGPILAGGFAAAALVLAAVAARQLSTFRVRRLELAIPALPAELNGMTIAHLSDLHVGRLTRGPVLEAMAREASALDADLAVVTGDLINSDLADFPAAAETIRSVRARHGTWVIEGNHDLIESRTGFEAAARASGLNFLFDDAVALPVRGETVQLLGLRWQSDPAPLLARRRADAFPILLAHHPHAFDAAAEAGIPLTLSGHTHGGQLRLTRRIGFGPWFYRYWEGVYEKAGRFLVVSAGTGNWFPLRWNTPAEIIHLTLRSAVASPDARSL